MPGRVSDKNMKTTLSILAVVAAAFTASTSLAADGAAVYAQSCTKCHGDDGKGQTKMGQHLGARDYTDAKTWDGLTDDAAIKAVKEGVVKDGKTVMKATEGVSDDDAKAVIAYMKTFKK
jgi:mono/diheme cytochrome c family protein